MSEHLRYLAENAHSIDVDDLAGDLPAISITYCQEMLEQRSGPWAAVLGGRSMSGLECESRAREELYALLLEYGDPGEGEE